MLRYVSLSLFLIFIHIFIFFYINLCTKSYIPTSDKQTFISSRFSEALRANSGSNTSFKIPVHCTNVSNGFGSIQECEDLQDNCTSTVVPQSMFFGFILKWINQIDSKTFFIAELRRWNSSKVLARTMFFGDHPGYTLDWISDTLFTKNTSFQLTIIPYSCGISENCVHELEYIVPGIHNVGINELQTSYYKLLTPWENYAIFKLKNASRFHFINISVTTKSGGPVSTLITTSEFPSLNLKSYQNFTNSECNTLNSSGTECQTTVSIVPSGNNVDDYVYIAVNITNFTDCFNNGSNYCSANVSFGGQLRYQYAPHFTITLVFGGICVILLITTVILYIREVCYPKERTGEIIYLLSKEGMIRSFYLQQNISEYSQIVSKIASSAPRIKHFLVKLLVYRKIRLFATLIPPVLYAVYPFHYEDPNFLLFNIGFCMCAIWYPAYFGKYGRVMLTFLELATAVAMVVYTVFDYSSDDIDDQLTIIAILAYFFIIIAITPDFYISTVGRNKQMDDNGSFTVYRRIFGLSKTWKYNQVTGMWVVSDKCNNIFYTIKHMFSGETTNASTSASNDDSAHYTKTVFTPLYYVFLFLNIVAYVFIWFPRALIPY